MRSSIQKTLVAYTLAKFIFISLKILYGSFNSFQLYNNFIQFIIPEMMKNENENVLYPE